MIEPGAVLSVDLLDNRYTKIKNAFVRDTRIPHTAFRIGVYVIGHAPEFRLTQAGIAKALGMHRSTVVGALGKLEDLGYVRRIPHFSRGGRQPDTILLGQEPRTEEEWDDLLVAHVEKANVAVGNVGKTDSLRRTNSKKTKREEDQPSGRGVPPATEEDPSTEEDMPRAAITEQPALFETPAPPPATRKKRKDPAEADDASAVLASFISSYVEHHGGRRPLGSDIGKVGKAAKLILQRAEATLEELIRCAARMGRGQYSDLFRELSFSRPATKGAGRTIPARRDDADTWSDMAAATAARLREIAAVSA